MKHLDQCVIAQLEPFTPAGVKRQKQPVFVTVSGCQELEALGLNSLTFKIRPAIKLLSYQRMSASQQHDPHNLSKCCLRSEE